MKPSSYLEPEAAAECRRFTRYLVRAAPSDYVLSCYARALPSAGDPGVPPQLIDRALLGLARLGGPATRIADAYATRFRPYGALRRRLILLLAILENAPPTATPLNTARTGSLPGTVVVLAGMLALSGLALVAGTLVLGPLHLVSLLRRGRP